VKKGDRVLYEHPNQGWIKGTVIDVAYDGIRAAYRVRPDGWKDGGFWCSYDELEELSAVDQLGEVADPG